VETHGGVEYSHCLADPGTASRFAGASPSQPSPVLLSAPLIAAVSLLLQVPAGRPAPNDTEALLQRVQTAVETGRDSAERAHWAADLAAGHARARLAVATIDRLTYRSRAAEDAYLALARDTRVGAEIRAGAAHGLGALLVQQGRYAEAVPVLRDAAVRSRSVGDGTGYALSLTLLASAYARTADISAARRAFVDARAAIATGDTGLVMIVTCSELVVQVQAGDSAAASRARRVATAAIRAGNRRAAAACLTGLAVHQAQHRNQPDSALATFDEVAALHVATRNFGALATTRQWQGSLLFTSLDQPHAARAKLEEAITLGRQTDVFVAQGWAALELAVMALKLGDLSSAGAYARRAAAANVVMGDRRLAIQVRLHEGSVALLSRNLPAARAAFEQVAREAEAVIPWVAARAYAALAIVALYEGDWPEAERQMDIAQRLAERLGIERWWRFDDYSRALLALERGLLGEAETRLRDFDRRVEPTDPGLQADVLTRLAEVLARAGRAAEAESALVRASELIDRRRALLPERAFRASVLQYTRIDWDRDLGFATAIAGLARAGRTEAAFELMERRRARLLLESLVRRRALAPHSEGRGNAAPVMLDLAAARRTIPDSTAMLAFVTGRGREPTTVFVVTRDGLSTVEVAPVDDHAREFERFAGLLAAGVDATDLAWRLGTAFLRTPLALVPAHVRALVIVPDGLLYRVPFDALVVGDRDGTPLVERYAISMAPSLTVAATWWREPLRAPRPRMVAFGDPEGARLAVSGDTGGAVPPPLPVAAREARSVGRFAPTAHVFTGRDASEARLRSQSLSDVGVLHFATHADVEEWSLMRSALVLAPGEGEDGRVTAHELLDLQLDASLVVLSACRSGGGTVLVGEGLQGLTVPFLEAGASAVVATLWQVGDRRVAPMIDLLYRELASGATVGDALHRAKRSARARGISPDVWAAFTLTGDARVKTALRPPPRRPATYASYLVPAGLMALGVTYVGRHTRRRRRSPTD